MAHARYQQIADRLRDQIASGVFGPGERLPSEPDLVEEYQASRNTVRLAIALLTNQGLVVTRQGLGTFVQQPTRPFTALLSRVNVPPGALHADTALPVVGAAAGQPERAPVGGGRDSRGERERRGEPGHQAGRPGGRPPVPALPRGRALAAGRLVLPDGPGPRDRAGAGGQHRAGQHQAAGRPRPPAAGLQGRDRRADARRTGVRVLRPDHGHAGDRRRPNGLQHVPADPADPLRLPGRPGTGWPTRWPRSRRSTRPPRAER